MTPQIEKILYATDLRKNLLYVLNLVINLASRIEIERRNSK